MAASRTAEYVAMYRALETSESSREPLFRDPFAERLLPRPLIVALKLARLRPLRKALVSYADWRAPGARTSAIGRTRFIDDVIRAEITRGVRQLVILGAGYDCRAHRMPELATTLVFEVDRSDTQAEKRARLEHQTGRRDVTYVPVDFTRDVLEKRLVDAGWARDRPTLFLWEGVTNYLDEASVAAVLEFVGTCAPSTALVFTYIHRAVLDGTASFVGADKLVRSVRKLGEPWTFGLLPDEVAPFVERFGLTVEKNLGADEYRGLYLSPTSTELRGYAFYRIAVTRVSEHPTP